MTHLHSEQTVSEAAYINEAARWADWLTKTEARGLRDTAGAWSRLEQKYGLSSQVFWSLRYRKPKTLIVSIYMRLKAAYDFEKYKQGQLSKLHDELQTAQVLGAPVDDLVAEISPLDSNEILPI